MKEALLQIAWMHRLYDDLICSHEVEVIDPGTHNPNAGADFFSAKIKIDGILWVGDVELHLHTRGWRAHRHNEDDGYTSVILHVAIEGDDEVYDCRGRLIPSARLVLPDSLENKAARLTEHACGCYSHPQLGKLLGQIDHTELFRRMLDERLEARVGNWVTLLDECQSDYVEVFHRLLFRYFGFGLNNDTMERLARSIPARAIIKQGDRLSQIEAMLLGQAGMLEDLPQGEAYVRELRREYEHLQAKYELKPLERSLFRTCRTRPSSFPMRRLLQLALLLHRTHLLSSRVLEVSNRDDLLQLFRQEGKDSFWAAYFGYYRGASLTLSAEACVSLGINVVSVYQLILARLRPDLAHLSGRAMALLSSLPAENNAIIRKFRSLGFTPQSASDSQALLELYKSYCQRRKCLYCPIGRHMLAVPATERGF
ncbi:MAG: DUF2851 family protein [Porphyromonadaceae bacterium]|nr:DUF2851 family protein [Porphyromonadaceae bacterium]